MLYIWAYLHKDLSYLLVRTLVREAQPQRCGANPNKETILLEKITFHHDS